MKEDFTDKSLGEADDIVLTLDKKGNEFFLKGKCNITGIERIFTYTEQQEKDLSERGINSLRHGKQVLFNEINSMRLNYIE